MTKQISLLNAAIKVHSIRATLVVLSSLTVALLFVGYVLIVRPDASYIQIFLDDVIGLTDAAYRTSTGAVPSINFRSIYGAAALYPAALGFHLGFEPGGVLAFGHFATAVFLLAIAVLASYRRLPTLPGAFFLVFLALLILVPHRPGGAAGDLSFAIFYTRHGWAALAIALLFYLEPRTISRIGLTVDSAILVLLLIYLFYLKITFGALAVAFVVANAMTSRYKLRLALLSVAAFFVIVGAIHVFTPYNSAYLSDIFGVVERTPALRRSSTKYVQLLLDHVQIFVICLVALAATFVLGRKSLFDFGFVVGAIVGSLMALEYSGGTTRYLPPLVTVLLVLGELARRSAAAPANEPLPQFASHVGAFVIFGMTLAVASLPLVNTTAAFYLYSTKLSRAQSESALNLAGLYVPQSPSVQERSFHGSLGHDEASHALFNRQRASALQLQSWEYLPLILEGVELLKSVPHDDHAVVTFEQTNPFAFALGMRSTEYGYPLNYLSPRLLKRSRQGGATTDRLDVERFFSDADYVMVPEVPFKRHQLEAAMEIYGHYLGEHFYELKKSPHWRLYARR